MNESNVERLLEESNALKREALALQREALAAQREIVEATRGNLELARKVNEGAAELQKRARRALALLIPVILVLIAYVSWLLLFRMRY